MRKLTIFFTLVGLLLITNGTALAVLVGAGRFDELIGNAKIIVKGKISQIDKPPFEMIAFRVEVINVLKSDGGEIPRQLCFETPLPIWPKNLGVPYTEGQLIILVLQRIEGKISIENNQGAILPATDKTTVLGEDSSAARKVFEELRAYLAQTEDEIAKGLVLVRLSQLGTKEDEKIFLPYMKSENRWLWRAASASLLRLGPAPERISEAVDDFAYHLSEVSQESLFWEMYVDVRWSARCGSFGMDKELADRARAYLPIYRVLIDKAPKGYQHVYVAIKAIKDVGTREDIPRLYRYIDDEKAWIRHDVLEGIGRILGMETKRPLIASYGATLSEEAKTWEKKTRSVIEQKLASENMP